MKIMSAALVKNIKIFIQEIQKVYNTGKATEHSYRKSLETLLESIHPSIQALNEAKRQSVGAPDFILFREKVQVAFLEAKDIPERLSDKKHVDQIQRYQALGNLCFTNNLDWRFYKGKDLVAEICIGIINLNGQIEIIEDSLDTLASFLTEFAERKTITINTSKELAEIMANKAKVMREILVRILEQDIKENNSSTIFQEYETFKKILIHDLEITQFADIYSQTVAYGLFTARYYDNSIDTFTRAEAANDLPKSNPFLRKLFQTIAGYDLDERLAWVVDNLVNVFAHSDVKALMADFGKATNVSDPVLHFYETFLYHYDPSTRKARGVYYTPDPVVKYIVKSVDEILQTEFNLPMGLADNSKIDIEISAEEAKNNSKAKKIGSKYFVDFHRVQILDPATGTGTFLLEVFNNIYTKFENSKGIWQSYAQNDLLPRIHGFEILMASYTMVHLKLAMFLTEKEVEIKNRLSVYLTNSLEEQKDDGFDLFSKWLTDEAEEASRVKNQAPVMVVIGNPPYSVSSSNSGEWIQNLIKTYKENLNERKINLDDDYIKFIRYGQHYIEKNGEGILAYISNNSFIDGVTHRQMRKSLMETFDKIYILDLHGNSKKKETTPDGGKDENVFDIQQGVSINIFVKKKKN